MSEIKNNLKKTNKNTLNKRCIFDQTKIFAKTSNFI